jgi:lipoate-protein ligase A
MEVLVEDCAGLGDQAANLALEEALVRAAPPRPLLRIWQNGACVVIGRGQRVWREVNMAACAARGVPVLRRASGGGTVYHDLGNLNISLVVPGREPGLAAELAALLAAVVGRLGLRASSGGRGVFIRSAKVSGLASQVTRDARWRTPRCW